MDYISFAQETHCHSGDRSYLTKRVHPHDYDVWILQGDVYFYSTTFFSIILLSCLMYFFLYPIKYNPP